MKITINSIWTLLLITTIFSGCFTERIDIDLNEENKKVVVEAWITNLDQPQFIKLSYTTNYLDSNSKNPIKGASVILSNSTTEYELNEKEDGTYYLIDSWSDNIKLEDEYTLSIIIEGETYTASAPMRPSPEIENLIYRKVIDEEFEEDNDTIIVTSFNFQETEGLGDGYFARDYKKGSASKDSLLNGSFLDDEFYDGIYFEDISVTNLSYEPGDTAIVELYSIGKEAAAFLQDIESEVFRGTLFDPPPVNIRTNFNNGAIGYFIIGGANRDTIIIE